jgi:hypothetical protein
VKPIIKINVDFRKSAPRISQKPQPAGAQNPTQKNEIIFSPQKIVGLLMGIAHAAVERLVSAACPLNSLNAHLSGGVRREQERGRCSH